MRVSQPNEAVYLGQKLYVVARSAHWIQNLKVLLYATVGIFHKEIEGIKYTLREKAVWSDGFISIRPPSWLPPF